MNRRLPYIVLFIALLFAAFQVPVSSDLVLQELDKRVKKYREEQREICKKKALEAAAHEVDSLIIEWAKANRDTLDRPEKPDKPLPPERKAPKDTTPVRPLFNGQDTLE